VGFVSASDTDNLVEGNEISGNANGVFLAAGVQGNIIRGNTIVGNPPVQVSVDHTSDSGVDIKNLAAVGANTFDGNICLSGTNAPCPALTPDAVSLLASQLQSLVCGNYPPAASCQVSLSVWNYYLVHLINPGAAPLVIGDSTQMMTVQQYLQARAAAGL
jgi:parallel beta-helix repeat protein